MKNFLTRLASGAVLILVVGGCALWGGLPFFLLICVLSAIGLWEYYRATGLWLNGLSVAGMFAGALFLEAVYMGWDGYLLLALFLGLALILGVYVFRYPAYTVDQVAKTVFGVLYVPVLLSFLYRIRVLPLGQYLTWLPFIVAWGSDVFAYCVGSLLGRHKLTPELSPHKSVEGAIGAVLGAGLLGALYDWLVLEPMNIYVLSASYSVLVLAGICAVGSVLAQIGDLVASAIKRNAGIKDYSGLIPGHGGVLDRFDSLLLTAPVLYYLILLLKG